MTSVSAIHLLCSSFFLIFPLVMLLRFFCMKFFKKDKHYFEPNERLFYYNKDQLLIFLTLHLVFILSYKTYFLTYISIESLILTFFIYFAGILFIFIVLADKYLKRNEFNVLSTLGCWMLLFILSFLFTNNFIVFVFNIELLAVIYLFFFLGYFKFHTISLLKYKNLLSTYLFSSFFTLLLFSAVLCIFVFLLGTVSFKQIDLLHSVVPRLVAYMLLISLLVKFGGPLFFFFKLEVYKLLPVSTLIFFSLSSFWLNSFLIAFIVFSCSLFFSSFTLFFLSLLLLGNILVMIRGLQLSNFCEFFAFSAVNTWGLFFLFFFLNVTNFLY